MAIKSSKSNRGNRPLEKKVSPQNFCFTAIRVGEGFPSQVEVARLVTKSLKHGKTYRRFADIPVTPKTVVYRIDTKGSKQQVWECAHSKTFKKPDGNKGLTYVSSSYRAEERYDFTL